MTDPYSGSIQLIRKKRKKNLIHEIYRYDHTLVKRFIKIAPLPDMRRPWQMEDAALRRLEGLGVPETYGFSIKKKNKKTEILYARQYLDGSPIAGFGPEDMDSMAKMIAEIHLRGVITRDPSLENFIRTPEGKVVFIDFGRSLLFHPKNPLILDYMGKELARIWFHAFAGNELLFARFRKAYFDRMALGRMQRFAMEKVSFKWYQFLMT